MNDKRDQVQAHMFIMGRLTSGMLRADPDAPESPQGRTNRGIVISLLIAVLLCAGSFVFGLLKPGTKNSWRAPGTLVVSKDSGARYLFLGGRLRPVRNFTSARLMAGDAMKVMSVSGASLEGIPRGAPVGIIGAPEEPPALSDLDDGPWQICSGTTNGSTATTLAVAAAVAGTGLTKDAGLLVRGPDKSAYLVWQGRKLLLDTKANASAALGYGADKPLSVSAAFLNSLPSNPDLSPPDVPKMGAVGPVLDGRETRIGQVFQVTATGAKARYYQLWKEGLAPITATQAALAIGDPASKKKAYDGGPVTVQALGTNALAGHLAPDSQPHDAGKDMPSAPPRVVDLPLGMTPCVGVRWADDSMQTTVTLSKSSLLGPTAQAPADGLTPACVTVNTITVNPGGGALVHALSSSGSDIGRTLYLVTDTGMKYKLPSKDALAAFGYTDAPTQGIPASLLAMLPTGPDLTPQAASSGRSASSDPTCGLAEDTGESSSGTGDNQATESPGVPEKSVARKKMNRTALERIRKLHFARSEVAPMHAVSGPSVSSPNGVHRPPEQFAWRQYTVQGDQ